MLPVPAGKFMSRRCAAAKRYCGIVQEFRISVADIVPIDYVRGAHTNLVRPLPKVSRGAPDRK